MQKIKILSKKEVKHIHGLIKSQWDAIVKLDYVFLQNKKDKLFIVNKEVFNIDETKLRIDSMGLYFGRLEHGHLRLSIEGSQIIGPHAKKNIIDLNNNTLKKWMRGEDIPSTDSNIGYQIIRHRNNFLGCGKIKNNVLMTYYPKSRRISS